MIELVFGKHFLLKFNHGVEIGARLAYLGHYQRTGDEQIAIIAKEELGHQRMVQQILKGFGENTNSFIDNSFFFIGSCISFLCSFCPIWSLNFVAQMMELFAVFNYRKLAKKYPNYEKIFIEMAETEDDHSEYFSTGKRTQRQKV